MAKHGGFRMAARGKRKALAEAKPTRSKATFDLPPELVAELRTASVLAGETLAAIAERGLTAELKRLRGKIMGGKPFPMPVKARKGRPPK
jgi:hypothetical protein